LASLFVSVGVPVVLVGGIFNIILQEYHLRAETSAILDELDRSSYEEDTRRLTALIKLRHMLWT
jgi:hypothetical protein